MIELTSCKAFRAKDAIHSFASPITVERPGSPYRELVYQSMSTSASVLDLAIPQSGITRLLIERFRCQEDLASVAIDPDPDRRSFEDSSSRTRPLEILSTHLPDSVRKLFGNLHVRGSFFDPLDLVDHLRFERYTTHLPPFSGDLARNGALRNAYYTLRPLLPMPLRRQLQRTYFRRWSSIPFPIWPVDRTVEDILEGLLVAAMKARRVNRVPFIWFWPNGASTCTVLTHDVETSTGLTFCQRLMDLDDSFGIKASFQIVPEGRYEVAEAFLESIRRRGFELNVHDLNHDGQLFSNRHQFLLRAQQINRYARKFGSLGFRSAILYRNLDWYDALDFAYDMSVPNVAHLDPQRGGCCTVFPFFVGSMVELPVTTTQDYSLFHILGDYSTSLWREQILLILQKHGLINLIAHPDYIRTNATRGIYTELLSYLSELRSTGHTWIALPRDVAAWWIRRSKLHLVNAGGAWRIEGEGSEHATIAHAVLVNDVLTYEVDHSR